MQIINPEGSRDVACIYKITNLKNGKIYIGQTVNYRKRSSDYMHAESKIENGPRHIYNVIKNEGSENFIMEPLYICDPEDLSKYEEYYIRELGAANPETGYNTFDTINARTSSIESRRAKSIAHTGLKESAETKKKKSNTILAIKGDKLIICDSGKLFGDYVGKNKDYIKNCLRQPSSIQGYHLYYDDYEKRNEIREKMFNKKSIRDTEYIDILDFINDCEKDGEKGLETIYSTFDVYRLQYNKDPNAKVEPVLESRKKDYVSSTVAKAATSFI